MLDLPSARPGRASARPRSLPPELRAALGRRLAELRQAQGLSLNDVATRMGMSRGALGNLERGQVDNPPVGTLLRLMTALNVTSVELLFGEPEFASHRLAQILDPPPV